jgi:hypothetical protein
VEVLRSQNSLALLKGMILARGMAHKANNEAFYAARVRAWAAHNERHFSF